MTTKEQLLAMSREELLRADVKEIWPIIQDLPPDEYLQVIGLFEQETSVWEKRIEQAFADRLAVAELIDLFRTEPAVVRVATWSRVTRHGIERIDYAKFVHAHFATPILELFGVVMPDGQLGIIPNVPGVFKAAARR